MNKRIVLMGLMITALWALSQGCMKEESTVFDPYTRRSLTIYFVDHKSVNIVGVDSGQYLPYNIYRKTPGHDTGWHQATWKETPKGFANEWGYFFGFMDSAGFRQTTFDDLAYFRFPGANVDTLRIRKSGEISVECYWNGRLNKSISAQHALDTLYITR